MHKIVNTFDINPVEPVQVFFRCNFQIAYMSNPRVVYQYIDLFLCQYFFHN